MARGQVLVVDDKESVLELMASILGGAYDVVTSHDPVLARALLADVLTRLGYGSECATWRNNFLTGALEAQGPLAEEWMGYAQAFAGPPTQTDPARAALT